MKIETCATCGGTIVAEDVDSEWIHVSTIGNGHDHGVRRCHMTGAWARELAWAAGLFEGEGSFVCHKVGSHTMGAQLGSTDRDVVERFCAAVGFGTVNGPYNNDSGGVTRKPVYKWGTSGLERTQALIALLWFGLGERRRARALEVLRSRGEVRGRIRSSAEARRVSGARWSQR